MKRCPSTSYSFGRIFQCQKKYGHDEDHEFVLSWLKSSGDYEQ